MSRLEELIAENARLIKERDELKAQLEKLETERQEFSIQGVKFVTVPPGTTCTECGGPLYKRRVQTSYATTGGKREYTYLTCPTHGDIYVIW